MVRSHILIASVLALCACPYEVPLPRVLELNFELEPERVVIEGALRDLVFRKEDALNNFVAYAQVADAKSFADSLHHGAHADWIAQVVSHQVEERDGQLSMRVAANATREMFDRCARLPADLGAQGSENKECTLFPLRIEGQRYVLAVTDGYAPMPRSQTSWPLTSKRIRLKLELHEDNARHRATSTYRLFHSDEKAAQRVVSWVHTYSEAYEKGDDTKIASLEKEIETHGLLTRHLLEEHAYRWHVSFLYRVLVQQRSRDIHRLESASYFDQEKTPNMIPKAGLPQSFVRDLRLVYEIGGRRAEAFADWRDQACRMLNSASKDQRYICALLGTGAAPKKILLRK